MTTVDAGVRGGATVVPDRAGNAACGSSGTCWMSGRIPLALSEHGGWLLISAGIAADCESRASTSGINPPFRALPWDHSLLGFRKQRREIMSTVLLVEDNANALQAMEALVASQGYLVRTAADGAQAMRIAKEQRPDIVISDWMMPVMDGLALLRAMRANARLADVPVVLTSATAGPPSGMCAVAFLRKPVAASQLLELIGRLIGPTSTARRPGTSARTNSVALDPRPCLRCGCRQQRLQRGRKVCKRPRCVSLPYSFSHA
ncbi:MAG TPA: response regulator [Paraburkholderia sp.]